MRLAVLFASFSFIASAQTVAPSMLSALDWRSIGPAATGGRIADLAIAKVPGEPMEIYVGTTSGGVFKSSNEGVSFTPVFDRAGGMMSIGAVAVAPSNPSVVWVGTGEADNRQSSSWGDGVYRSTDGGQTGRKWDSTRPATSAKSSSIPPTPTRFTWLRRATSGAPTPTAASSKPPTAARPGSKVLYKDDNTGAIDLAMDPKDPDVVFAAMYQRQRKGWGFNGGGPGSGIYRTTDGGATWTELTRGFRTATRAASALRLPRR